MAECNDFLFICEDDCLTSGKQYCKIYLCNEDGTVSLFLSILACHIFNLAVKLGISLIPAYIPTYLHVEADYLL